MKILKNAKIYTMDLQNPLADTIAIEDSENFESRIVAVGYADQIIESFNTNTKVEDMNGAVIIPGLTDSHFHLQHYAHNLKKINLFEISKRECLDRVAERARSTHPGKWILGHGWNQIHFSTDFPTAADLDTVAPDNPVYLTATSLHAAWVNSAALKKAGITSETPDPPNGSFGRDEKGYPNGMLFESAMRIIEEEIPNPSLEENKSAIMDAIPNLWKLGLTGLHDFDRFPSYTALQELEKDQQLRLRIIKSLPVEELNKVFELRLRSGMGSHLLKLGSIKVFMDGALGSRTAAMLEPFEGEPENTGMLFINGDEFFELVREAVLDGWSIAAHAIGDRANHELINGYQKLRELEKSQGVFSPRHRIEHGQLLKSEDISRIAELELIASMQPYHLAADIDMADKYWGERSRNSFVFRSFLDQGTKLAFGSDAPVDSENPFHGIHSAVTRCRANGFPNSAGWYPDEKISPVEAIYAYTAGAAYAGNSEDRLGKLSSGYLADLLVLDIDPFKCDPMQLFNIGPKATMLGGEWVWRA